MKGREKEVGLRMHPGWSRTPSKPSIAYLNACGNVYTPFLAPLSNSSVQLWLRIWQIGFSKADELSPLQIYVPQWQKPQRVTPVAKFQRETRLENRVRLLT